MSDKINPKDLKWNDQDVKNNLALKQNLYKIGMMNLKVNILDYLDSDLSTITKLLEGLKKVNEHVEKIEDKEIKKDYKAKCKQYSLYLEGIHSKIKAATIYMKDLDVELKDITKTKKPRAKKVKKE